MPRPLADRDAVERFGRIATSVNCAATAVYGEVHQLEVGRAIQVIPLAIRPFASAHLLPVDPQLPDWPPELRVRSLGVGDAVVDLHAWRHHDRTRWDAPVRSGRLHLSQRQSLRSPRARTGRVLGRLVSR